MLIYWYEGHSILNIGKFQLSKVCKCHSHHTSRKVEWDFYWFHKYGSELEKKFNTIHWMPFTEQSKMAN